MTMIIKNGKRVWNQRRCAIRPHNLLLACSYRNPRAYVCPICQSNIAEANINHCKLSSKDIELYIKITPKPNDHHYPIGAFARWTPNREALPTRAMTAHINFHGTSHERQALEQNSYDSLGMTPYFFQHNFDSCIVHVVWADAPSEGFEAVRCRH